MILINALKHFNTIMKHKWVVFKLSMKAGIPLRGLKHDLSKFSPTEFWESAKYYQGNRSPIMGAKLAKGYSKAWLHHKGRNKHHPEYWHDPRSRIKAPIIPYKYTVEMICDTLAAGIVYSGKNWTRRTQLEYWEKERNKSPLSKEGKELLTDVYTQIAEKGINPVLTPKNLKTLYKKYCGKGNEQLLREVKKQIKSK